MSALSLPPPPADGPRGGKPITKAEALTLLRRQAAEMDARRETRAAAEAEDAERWDESAELRRVLAARERELKRALSSVAAVRALADDLEAEADATRPDDFLHSTEPSAVASHNYDCGLAAEMEAAAKRIRIALDGSPGSPEPTLAEVTNCQCRQSRAKADIPPVAADERTQIRAFMAPILSEALDNIRTLLGLPSDTSEVGAVVDAVRRLVAGVETAEILRDPEMAAAIREGEAALAAGDVVTLDEFRAMAAGVETPAETGGTPETPREPIDDHVTAWIKATRDRYAVDTTEEDHPRAWYVLDDLLDDYRLHRVTGTPLDQHACEGGYCCADEPAAALAGTAPTPQPAAADELDEGRDLLRRALEKLLDRLRRGTFTPADLTLAEDVTAALKPTAATQPGNSRWGLPWGSGGHGNAAPVLNDDEVRAVDAVARGVTLIGTHADPFFVAHQDHKHPVEGCGFCPSEEDR